MRSLHLVLIVLVLWACSQRVWVKPGSTQEDLRVDSLACDKEAKESASYGSSYLNQEERGLFYHRFYDECMETHGWSLQTQRNGGE